MRHRLYRFDGTGIRLCTSVLALGCASGALACSGDYPLGTAQRQRQLLDGDTTASVPAPALDQATVEGALPPPEVTIGLDDVSSPSPSSVAAVGDLDGDGFADTAMSALDFATGVSYVQVRYGGPRPSTPVEELAFDEDGPRLIWSEDALASQPTLTAAGDVDGDGYADLLIKSFECDQTEAGEGAYLLYGGPERLTGTPFISSISTRFVPPSRGADIVGAIGCGGNLAGAPGDLDGDGLDDFVLTVSPQLNLLAERVFPQGVGAYVFYGRTSRFAGELPYASADAYLASGVELQVNPVGDIDGDGLAEFMLADPASSMNGVYLVPGSSERLRGSLDLKSSVALLAARFPSNMVPVPGGFDLDGDGIHDVLLSDDVGNNYLFYGAPELFADGIDFAQADLSFGSSDHALVAAGDRDGDGDTELLSMFALDETFIQDVALLSGQRTRRLGEAAFPKDAVRAAHPRGFFGDDYRSVEFAFPAGDLDGDGAGELLTLSALRIPQGRNGFAIRDQQLHIHYGVPATATAATPPLR